MVALEKVSRGDKSAPAPSGKGLWLVLGGCAATAVGTLVSKRLLETVPPLHLMLAELLFSAIFAWAAAAVRSKLPRRKDFLRIAAPGILQPALVWVLVLVGLKSTPATVEALLFASETIVVVLLAWLLIGEKPTLFKFALCALSTTGVILITEGGQGIAAPPLSGCLFILGGVAAAALDTVVCRALLQRDDPLSMTAAIQVPSLLIVGAVFLLWPEPAAPVLLDPAILLQTALAGICLHWGAAFLFNCGLVTVDAGTVALLFPTLTVMTVAGGLVFFSERLGYGQWFGAALVLAAAVAIGWADHARKKPA